MIVLDTHAWIWWTDSPDRLSRRARQAIDRADEIGVCTISVLELVQQVEAGRLRLSVPLQRWVSHSLAQERVRPLPLTVEVALDAGRLRFAGDPADRIVYATARAERAVLITRDERLRAFDPDLTLW